MSRIATDGHAVVIGSAGGIGTALVEELLRREISVTGVDREAATVDADTYHHLSLDWSSPGAVQSCLDHLDSLDHRVLRYVIDVAGGALPAEVDSPSPLDFVWDVSGTTSSINLTTALVSVSLAREARTRHSDDQEISITLCSSANAIGGFNYPLYSASKGAVESLVHSLCIPLGQIHVRINCVRFGTVMTEQSLRLHGGQDNPHYRPLLELSALGRFVSAAEAACALAGVAADLTGMTGAVIPVDAGQSVAGVRTTKH